jgi:Lipase (class 3)
MLPRPWLIATLTAAALSQGDFVSAADAQSTAVPRILPLEIYRNRSEVPILNLRNGTVRWVTVVRNVNPLGADHGLGADAPQRTSALFFWREGDNVLCTCTGVLRDGEFLINEEPVRDAASGKYISIDDASFKELTMLANYPTIAPNLSAGALADLAYVTNEYAVRLALELRGFDTEYIYGFFGAASPEFESHLHLFVARNRRSGEIYLAIRGTNDISDMLTNLAAQPVSWDGKQGRVHGGFRKLALAAVKLVKPILLRLHQDSPGAPLIACGHSLGAAVAALVNVSLNASLPALKTIALAMPPVGTAGFVSEEAEPLALVTSYFVSHDEIRELGSLAGASHFQWIGREVTLGDMGRTAGHYHYVINYLKGLLTVHGLPLAPFERQMPICTLRGLPCFTGRHELVIPLCVYDDALCLDRDWPQMAKWMAATPTNPQSDLAEAHLIEETMIANPPPDDIRPLIFLELAALHAGTDGATSSRFLAAARVTAGDAWLVRAVQSRLAGLVDAEKAEFR